MILDRDFPLSNMNVRILSFITIFFTFLLLIIGGIVHNTQSSLACPDWPLCYGQFFPKMEGGILIEHGHRLTASLVGFLTVLIAFFSWKSRKISVTHASLFRLSLLALFLVIIQGALGGLTVIYKLPTIVSTSHLGLAMIFFLSLIKINHLAGLSAKHVLSAKLTAKFKQSYNPILRHGLLLALALLYSQILLGAFMRHAGAGTACGVGPANSLMCLDITNWVKSWLPLAAPARLHMAHRYWGVIAAFALLLASFRCYFFFLKKFSYKKIQMPSLIWYPVAVSLVILGQIFVGILTVAQNISNIPTTLHLALAALAFGLLYKYQLKIKKLETEVFPQGVHSLFSDFIDLTKPKLSLLVMVTVYVGMLATKQSLNFFNSLFILFLISMVVAGAAALNCYLERDIDAKMDRTKDRPLPAGRMKASSALIFGIVLLVISLPSLYFFVNATTAALAVLAFVSYIYAYTPLKQKSILAVLVGGIPGALPPLMGRTAVVGEFDEMGLYLFLILYIWQLPHFLAISITHANDYKAADILVFPNLVGVKATKKYIFGLTATLFLTAVIPYYNGLASRAYMLSATTLSLIFLLIAAWGFFYKNEGKLVKEWAKRYFWASIFYLPLLLSSLIYFQ